MSLEISDSPFRLVVNTNIPISGEYLFEEEIPQTHLKHSHYKVQVKYHITMSAVRAEDSYGSGFSGKTSGVFLETNLQPYKELNFNNGKFTSMTKQVVGTDYISSPDYEEYLIVDKMPPVLTAKLWDQENRQYISNGYMVDITAVFTFWPMTPVDKTIGANNMNRFVGAAGYPTRAL